MQTCNFISCEAPANFGILSEGDSADLESQACTEHVGNLLEPGQSTVWPLANATSLSDETISTSPPIGYGLRTDNGHTTKWPIYKSEDVTGPDNFWPGTDTTLVQAEADRLNQLSQTPDANRGTDAS